MQYDWIKQIFQLIQPNFCWFDHFLFDLAKSYSKKLFLVAYNKFFGCIWYLDCKCKNVGDNLWIIKESIISLWIYVWVKLKNFLILQLLLDKFQVTTTVPWTDCLFIIFIVLNTIQMVTCEIVCSSNWDKHFDDRPVAYFYWCVLNWFHFYKYCSDQKFTPYPLGKSKFSYFVMIKNYYSTNQLNIWIIKTFLIIENCSFRTFSWI